MDYDKEELTAEIQDHVKSVTAPYKYPRKVCLFLRFAVFCHSLFLPLNAPTIDVIYFFRIFKTKKIISTTNVVVLLKLLNFDSKIPAIRKNTNSGSSFSKE